jgi:hypothetical protein
MHMSLEVPTALLARAEAGPVDDTEFVACVRDSLPYAWEVVSDVADRLADADPAVEFVDHATPPPSEAHRGQLLRALASDSIRGSLERHFGVALAFQNCHRVAAFRPTAVDGPTYAEFVSPAAQLRNQSPELRDC